MFGNFQFSLNDNYEVTLAFTIDPHWGHLEPLNNSLTAAGKFNPSKLSRRRDPIPKLPAARGLFLEPGLLFRKYISVSIIGIDSKS